jgi:serine phosphatase RsbU (regulator of sigma subunit)
MSSRRVFLLILIASVGYLSLAWMFQSIHPAAKLGFDLDRQSVIAKARKQAVAIDQDAATWPAGVGPTIDQTVARYLDDSPDPEISRLLSIISTRVEMPDPRTDKSLEVRISGNGRITSVNRGGFKPDATRALSIDEQKELAQAALKQLAPDEWQGFKFKQSSVSDATTRSFTWEMRSPGEDRIRLVADASVQNDIVTRTSINPEFTSEYRTALQQRRSLLVPLNFVSLILLFLGTLFALIIYFRNVIRKEVRHSSTFFAWLVTFAVTEIWLINSSIFEGIYTSLAFNPQLQRFYLGHLLAGLVVSLLALGLTLPFFLFWGAGYPEASRLARNPLSQFELFLRGKLLSRKVGTSILVGLAFGWVGPVIAYAVARLIKFGQVPSLSIESTFADLFVARVPLLVRPLSSSVEKLYLTFVLFFFVLPFLLNRFRRASICHAVIILAGAVAFLGSDEFVTGVAAAAFASVTTVVLLDRLIFRASFLAGITALITGDFAVKLCALVSQPSLTLQWYGWVGWIVVGFATAGSAAVALRGRVLSEEDARAPWFSEDQLANREELELLKAQFQVARRAQQQMLPEAPPSVPGVEIAAVCLPAREVGGDFFDFLSLPNGSVGIVVADVSGKGVPASLYMTLTKGLLTSVAESTSDPGAIVREVNKHLYVACKQKMFVTLLLGVVDPESRTFSYARAGHNHPVWRRGLDGETRLLGARGIGLGLNSGELFDRTLELEKITLGAGDLLILYSDGISEAMNESREEYGEMRLQAVASRADGMSASKVKDLILGDVRSFLGRTPPQDDQTLVVVKVLS